MSESLKDKIAIITGSATGIGAAIARRFAAEGARVVISDLNGEAASETAKGIPGAISMQANVTSEDDLETLVSRTVEEFGGLHIMVANAGVMCPTRPITETPLREWRQAMAVNLDGVFLSIRASAAAIIASGGGSIIALSSVSATGGTPLQASYGASKAAVRSLAATAAGELRDHGVRVNALMPGFADTPFISAEVPQFEAAIGLPPGGFVSLLNQKQGRLVQPYDVASAAVFLASDQSLMVNGAGLLLDGGFTSQLF